MSTVPPITSQAPAQSRVLRGLFLMLFLRGRSARGFNRRNAPRSVASKLTMTLLFYGLLGCVAFHFLRQPVFVLSLYLHAMTFVFVGMFVTGSAGEVLFNKEESDILLHRPVSPGVLLWAKIRVLVEVSLWLGGAFNLAGLLVGLWAANGDWRFPLVHALSTVLETLWCTSCVVVVYQLCLRWFGREKLDGLMTAAQIVVSVTVVLGSQLLPQMAFRLKYVEFDASSWWMLLLPPAWFAGLDDALAGSLALGSWLLAGLALAATALVLWIAFGKLARDYEKGMRTLQEAAPSRQHAGKQGSRRWMQMLVSLPPWRWWLRDRVARASFLLVLAYLVRDRDVKLRVFPGMAPMLVMPFIFMFRGVTGQGGFAVAFAGSYVGLVPLMGISLLQYSQQWQASDIFRAAPIAGPGPLCQGARCAVLTFLTLPVIVAYALAAWLLHRNGMELLLLLPGIIALPVYALVANLGGAAVPLSIPTDAAKSTGRGLTMIVVMLVSMALSAIAYWAWSSGWFLWYLLGEALLAGAIYATLRLALTKMRWQSME